MHVMQDGPSELPYRDMLLVIGPIPDWPLGSTVDDRDTIKMLLTEHANHVVNVRAQRAQRAPEPTPYVRVPEVSIIKTEHYYQVSDSYEGPAMFTSIEDALTAARVVLLGGDLPEGEPPA